MPDNFIYYLRAFMRKTIAFLLVALLSDLASTAQKPKFLPGYYITHKGDTINGFGFIENRDKIRSFDFKPDPDSVNHTRIAALDCKEVTFGKDSYETWYGKRSLEYVNGNDLYTVYHQGEFATDSICIVSIYQGRGFALYQYQGNEKKNFFIKVNNSIDELTISYVYLTDELNGINHQLGMYFKKKTYQSQIYSLLNSRINTKKKFDLLWATEFDRHSLLKLFRKIDEE